MCTAYCLWKKPDRAVKLGENKFAFFLRILLYLQSGRDVKQFLIFNHMTCFPGVNTTHTISVLSCWKTSWPEFNCVFIINLLMDYSILILANYVYITRMICLSRLTFVRCLVSQKYKSSKHKVSQPVSVSAIRSRCRNVSAELDTLHRAAPTLRDWIFFIECCMKDAFGNELCNILSWSLVQRSPTDCGASLCVI